MDDDNISEEEKVFSLDKPYLGKAGEYLTAGKLLLNGFNVFAGAIDEGIDLVASKNGKFYKLQVKTCQDLEGYDSGKFVISVNLSTLSRHDPQTTYVVLVVHYLNGQISLDNAGDHNTYDQAFLVVPVNKIFEVAQSSEGRVTMQVKSTVVVGTSNDDWFYRLVYKKRELVLDDYLMESFSRIG